MKITLFDPYLRKFTDGFERHWLNQGHEVKMARYYDPELVRWGDVIYFFTCDNNLKMATNPPVDNPDFAGYDMHDMDLAGKRIVVQPIDIECWYGHHLECKWDLVDDVIFIADHILNMVDPWTLPGRREDMRVHTVQLGVDLDKWTFKERGPGFNVAIISEKWTSKGTDLLLQLMLKLKNMDSRWKFYWLGQRSDYPWEYAYFDDFVEHHQLPVEFINILNDGRTVDDFLDDKNYLLHASHKEAWSAATAEAMAKGIKPVVHRFYGADDIWPGMTWDTLDEAITMLDADNGTNRGQPYNSVSYRQYLIDHEYTLPQSMVKIDRIIKGE